MAFICFFLHKCLTSNLSKKDSKNFVFLATIQNKHFKVNCTEIFIFKKNICQTQNVRPSAEKSATVLQCTLGTFSKEDSEGSGKVEITFML